MSMTRSLRKALNALKGFRSRVDQNTRDITDLKKRFEGFDAKRDAMAVPPGSTLFDADRLRLYRLTSPNGTTATAKLQTLDASGNPVDDTVDTDDHTLYRMRPGVVPAVFEGTDSSGVPRYVMLSGIFPARVSSPSGSDNQWTYTITEIYKSSTGYDGWSDLSGGRTGTAYNFAEDQNAATGVQGNGVDQDNLDAVNDSGGGTDGTHALQPIPAGTRVLCIELPIWSGSAVTAKEYWIIQVPNGVDGACPVPA